MKPRRTARRLPRYTLRKVRREGHAYFFNPPSWARAAGCPVRGEPLGSDYAAAVERAESVLLPAFDSWRSGGVTDAKIIGAVHGTLDWLFGEYRNDRRYTGLGRSTQANHEYGFRLVGGYLLKDGRRLGEARLSAISAPVVDAVFEKLLFVTAADGSKRERRTCVNMAMKSCRRAWNVAARRHPGKVGANPFASMGLVSSSKETPTATYAELQAFRTKAVELGFASLATASLVGWEWLQRRADIFGTFDVAHYRPKEQPDAVRVLHEKTKEEAWIPLFDVRAGRLSRADGGA